MLSLIYCLNKSASVIVKTPIGNASDFEVDLLVKQGTILGAAACCASTGEYCGKNKGVNIGETNLSSLLYVDDIIDINKTVEDAVKSHENAIMFSRKKKLQFSDNKCKTIIVNKKKNQISPSLNINNVHIEEVTKFKYLGDIFNEKGNNVYLIEDRVAKGHEKIV